MRVIVLLLIIIPALEIALLMLSGRTLGVIPTVLLIIATGILGAYLAKQQGLETIRNAQEQLQYGRVPGDAIVDGLCILVGGVVLLTPGFITDAMGFILLVPTTRKFVKPLFYKLFKKLVDNRTITILR